MDTASGEVFGLVMVMFAIRSIVSAVNAIAKRADAALAPPVDATPPAEELTPPPPEYRLPAPLPLMTRIAAWWRRVFQSRKAVDGELLLDIDETATYRVTLPMPRRIVRLEALFDRNGEIPLEDVAVTGADGQFVLWSGRWRPRGKRACLRLDFSGGDRLTGVTITTRLQDPVDCDVELRLLAGGEPDAPYLEAAATARHDGDVDGMRESLEKYEQFCQTNPVSALHLANIFRHAREDKLAEIHALRAMGLDRVMPAVEICRSLAQRRQWQLEPERLQGQMKLLESWEIEGHHGLVVLMQDRAYLAGPGGYVRERFHAAYLVRRKAAARKFRSLPVPFVAGPGGLIHTEAQVRRSDGTVEVLDEDHFTVGSAQDDNPFIAVARKRTGIWILNDLAPGDVVEYTWDMVRLGKNEGESHDLFMLANIADTDTPTLIANVSFTAPADWDLAFAVRNTRPDHDLFTDSATEWTTTYFERKRVMPRRSHSLPYQATHLNPLVGSALSGPSWSEVGRSLLQSSCAAVAATPAVPAPLAEVCAGGGTPREVLARAFYWIRDRIKYASVASANRDLGSPERAERIVTAGMGDCKDTSLLLAVVCRHHGIPWEFVLMSVDHGVILDELPADQFDHMLVRACIGDEWLYLDAAGDATLFGSPPFPFQGVTVLTGPEGGELVPLSDIPLDRTRVLIHETVESIEGGQLVGSIELRLEGHPARMIDEVWKHQSLVALDPERAADEAIRHMVPEYEVSSLERLADTATSDTLHVVARGRRGRLVPLDGHRIAALSFGAPALPVVGRRSLNFQERYAFLMRGEFVYCLELTEPVRRVLRGVSTVADLATPFCSVSEEYPQEGDGATIVRRIRITERLVDGDSLKLLPAALERIEEATHVVVSLAGEGQAADG